MNIVYLFKPLIKKGSLDTKKAAWVFYVFFLIVMSSACIYYQFYSILVFNIIFFVVCFFYILNREDNPEAWYLDKYKVVKIDCTNKLLWLDNEKFSLNQISLAKVFFDECPPLYWKGNKGYGYDLINAKIQLYFKDGTEVSVPVQYETKLKKIISILRKYFVVEVDGEVGEYNTETDSIVLRTFVIAVSVILILQKLWAALIIFCLFVFVIKYLKENLFYNSKQ